MEPTVTISLSEYNSLIEAEKAAKNQRDEVMVYTGFNLKQLWVPKRDELIKGMVREINELHHDLYKLRSELHDLKCNKGKKKRWF